MIRRGRRRAARRAGPAALLSLVIAAVPALPADAVEIHPQDAYIGATTVLGTLGGAALGTALGGLSRAQGGNRVAPFVRWGGVGAGFGALLGYEVGRVTVNRNLDPREDVPTESTREVTACFGALAGELIGLGIGSLVTRPVNRDNREVWAGMTIGALVGAAGGFLIRPARVLAPPRAVSRAQRSAMIEQRTIEPLLPPESAPPAARMPVAPLEPALTARQTRTLATALLEPESERLAGVTPPLMHERPRPLLPHLPPSAELTTMARSVTILSLLEGAVLGAAIGGALSADAKGAETRFGIGAGLGALAGWSLSSSMARPWLAGSDGGWGSDEALEDGRRMSGVCAGGLLGALAGGAAGLAVRSASPDRGPDTVALAALGGNVAGLLAGWLLTGR